jgi:hypothetical protein
MSQPLIREPSHASRMREEAGQTMAEYGVVLSIITVAIIAAITVFSDRVELSILRVVDLVPK